MLFKVKFRLYYAGQSSSDELRLTYIRATSFEDAHETIKRVMEKMDFVTCRILSCELIDDGCLWPENIRIRK